MRSSSWSSLRAGLGAASQTLLEIVDRDTAGLVTVMSSTRYSAKADFILAIHSARSVPEATILAIGES